MIDTLKRRAGSLKRKILLADATDERILHAAEIAISSGIAEIEFVGNEKDIHDAVARIAPSLGSTKIWSQESYPGMDTLVAEYYENRKTKVADPETARTEIFSDPLLFGALLVHSGLADGLVAGSLSTTASIIRAGLRGIGLAADVRSLSSMFLLNFLPIAGHRESSLTLAFADCAVIPNPDAHQLADIALSTAETFRQLTDITPRIAMLSFSTKGSASNDSTKTVTVATEIVRERRPDLLIDGELQFDAAFVAEVSERKAPESPLKGDANVFIFPNLDAGNIGYKIAERLGMGQAIGPILQGLAKPMNDLSRGANVDDIVTMIAVTALQAEP